MISAREIEEARLKEAEGKGRAELEAMISEGRLRARRNLLRRKEELIEAAFSRARGKLIEHVKTRKYEDGLIRNLKRAISNLGAKEVVVRANRRDLEIIERERKNVERETGASISVGEQMNVTGGFRVIAPALRVEVDETFEGKLEREIGNLRIKVAETLFKDLDD